MLLRKIVSELFRASIKVDVDAESIARLIKQRVEQNPELLQEREYCRLAVNCAAQSGHLKVIQWLHAQGVTVEGGKIGPFSIVRAASNGHLDVLKYLHQCGVSLLEKDEVGKSLIYYALFKAAGNGHLDVFKYLHQCGVSLLEKDEVGRSPMHYAAVGGHIHIFEWLLEKGLSLRKEDNNGGLIIHSAAVGGQLGLLKYLHQNKISLLEKDRGDRSLMHYAAAGGHIHILEWLLKKDFTLTESANQGVLFIHAAASHGQLDVIQWAWKKNASLLAEKTQDGQTVVHLLINVALSGRRRYLSFEAIQRLLKAIQWVCEKNASLLTERNNSGDSPLQLAVNMPSTGAMVVNCLYKLGAPLSEKDNRGHTLLHRAILNSDLQMVKCLIWNESPLEESADVGLAECGWITPLQLATCLGHLDMVQCLVSAGASLTRTCANGMTVLHLASMLGSVEMVDWLCQQDIPLLAQTLDSGQTPLHSAAVSGRIDIIKCLLSHGVSLTEVDRNGQNIVHYAALRGRLNVLQWLLGKQVPLTAKTNGGLTAVHAAAQEGHLDVLKWLLGKQVPLTAKTNGGLTAVHVAAENGHLDVLEWLFEQGLSLTTKTNAGATAVHVAAENGHLDVLEWLFEQGLSLTAKTNAGATAVHVAAFKGHLSVLKWLFEQGLLLTAKTNAGETAVHVAAQEGHLDVLKWLFEQGLSLTTKTNIGATAVHVAAKNGHLDVLKWLLGKQVPLTAKTNAGETAVHVAAQEGHLDVLKWLFEQKLSLLEKTNEGTTVLHIAANNNNLPIVKWLLKKKVPLMEESTEFLIYSRSEESIAITPLQLAICRGHLDMVQCLVNAGASLTRTCADGMTVLHLASMLGSVEMVDWLCQQDIPLSAPEANLGQTPLHTAAANGHIDIIKCLLSHGVSLTEVDHRDQNIVHFAAYAGCLNVLQWLLDKEVDFVAKTDTGITAVYVAASRGHLNVVKWLFEQGLPLSEKAEGNWTALLVAASEGHFETVKWLLQHGASLLEATDGWNVLHMAAKKGHYAFVKWLINETRIDIMAKTTAGQTVLSLCDNSIREQVVVLITAKGFTVEGEQIYPIYPEAIASFEFIFRLKQQGELDTPNTKTTVLLDRLYESIAKQFIQSVHVSQDSIEQLVFLAQQANSKNQYLSLLKAYICYLQASPFLNTQQRMALLTLLKLANRGHTQWLTIEELTHLFSSSDFRAVLTVTISDSTDEVTLQYYLTLWLEVLSALIDANMQLDTENALWVSEQLKPFSKVLNLAHRRHLQPLLELTKQTLNQITKTHTTAHLSAAALHGLAALWSTVKIAGVTGFAITVNPLAVGGLVGPLTDLGRQTLGIGNELRLACLERWRKKAWCRNIYQFRQELASAVMLYLQVKNARCSPDIDNIDEDELYNIIEEMFSAILEESAFENHAAARYLIIMLVRDLLQGCVYGLNGVDKVRALCYNFLSGCFFFEDSNTKTHVLQVLLSQQQTASAQGLRDVESVIVQRLREICGAYFKQNQRHHKLDDKQLPLILQWLIVLKTNILANSSHKPDLISLFIRSLKKASNSNRACRAILFNYFRGNESQVEDVRNIWQMVEANVAQETLDRYTIGKRATEYRTLVVAAKRYILNAGRPSGEFFNLSLLNSAYRQFIEDNSNATAYGFPAALNNRSTTRRLLTALNSQEQAELEQIDNSRESPINLSALPLEEGAELTVSSQQRSEIAYNG